MKLNQLFLSIAISLFISGCEKPSEPIKTPEDLEILCAHLDQIADKSKQQEISGKCLRRSKFKPSEQKGY